MTKNTAQKGARFERALLTLAIAKGASFATRGASSKSTFFQSVNYLQNLGPITLIKKKIGRYYTMESQILLSDESIVSGELKKRL